MKILISFTTILLLATCAYAQQPFTVRVVYFTPSDKSVPIEEVISQKRTIMIQVQKFYALEMRKYGYGEKTFTLEKDANNRVVIHKVRGTRKLKEYSNLNLIIEELDEKLGDSLNKGEIRVVFVTGLKTIGRNEGGRNLWMCKLVENNGDLIDFTCSHHNIIPAEEPHMLQQITAHEIGHAFGLNHNPDNERFLMKLIMIRGRNKDLDLVDLSYDEARWLSVHKFFSDADQDKSIPKITKVHRLENININGKQLNRFKFDIKNDNLLHQAYLSRSGDSIVLGYDEITTRKTTAKFDVFRRNLVGFQTIRVDMIDIKGNMSHNYFDLPNVPGAPSNPHLKALATWGEIKARQ